MKFLNGIYVELWHNPFLHGNISFLVEVWDLLRKVETAQLLDM